MFAQCAVDRGGGGRRGRGASGLGISAMGAASPGGRGETCGGVDTLRLHAGIMVRAGVVPASLLVRFAPAEAGEQVQQAGEQFPHQHGQRPRAGRGTQCFDLDGKTLGGGGGVGFHVL
jgi:hypothetical protein